MEEKTIIIYTASLCRNCKKAKNHIEKRGFVYVEKNIEMSQEANTEMIIKTEGKYLGFPVIDIDGEVILGADLDKIDSALGF